MEVHLKKNCMVVIWMLLTWFDNQTKNLEKRLIYMSCFAGESNSGAHTNKDMYNCTFPAMIDDWRKKFSQSGGTRQLFPFGFVQVT
jgi:hypothetical protein